MTNNVANRPPSVDRIVRESALVSSIKAYGRVAVVEAIRFTLQERRNAHLAYDIAAIVDDVATCLRTRHAKNLKRVFNLTGTVLHTNLGRAILSEAAVAHAAMAMREACNLEFNIEDGQRGERDFLVEDVLLELTGAEAVTIVNNNAAAVLLVLAALAHEREVVVSRGELIEIGGAFRIPDVMRCAHARLVEVGTTNRTHPRDYENAVGPDTAALMKVHTSNYQITGFTASVSEPDLAKIAHAHKLPLVVDLGAGSLVELTAYGLPKEPVVRDMIAAGADIVTFSGDKLLGGPQAGLIAGRKDLIDRIKKHPLKRALRVSKITLAALEATLMTYRQPDLLTRDIPTMRLLTRPHAEITALAQSLLQAAQDAVGDAWTVTVRDVSSQVGSGSLPTSDLPSAALAISSARKKSGAELKSLATRFRALPIPVIGRIADDAFLLDLRCLEDVGTFVQQLSAFTNTTGA